MIEDIKLKIVYDIEVYPNFFCFNAKKLNEDKWYRFKLNDNSNLNDILQLKAFLETKAVWIAFNQIHYDDVVLSFIIKKFKKYINTPLFLKEIFNFSDNVINLENNYEFVKPYKYNNTILNGINIDLFLYWSQGLRISKKISLKSLGVGLKHNKLQELPYKVGTYLTLHEQEEVFKYCDNDVLVTEKLYNNLYDTSNTKTGSIKLRDDVYKQTGLQCYSWDIPKIASETLALAYSNKRGIETKEVKNFKFKPYSNLKIESLFTDIDINFKTDILKKVWINIKNSIDKVEEEFVFICKNTRIKIAVVNCGIHSVNNNEKYFTDSKFDLYTSDVLSLYPTNIINAKTIRFEEVLEEYINTKKERIIAKAQGNKSVDKFKKLILNSTSGLLDSQYSWLYYPEGAIKLRLLGQLQLLMFEYVKISQKNQIVRDNRPNVITDIMNVPYRNPLYSNINTVGRTWIFKYTLSICREIEAHIRIQYANLNVQGIGPLQGGELITDARKEKEDLILELKEMLNEVSRRSQLERKQQEAEFTRDTLTNAPTNIYIM